VSYVAVCFICDGRYDANAPGAGPLRCRACVARGRRLVTELEAAALRLLDELAAIERTRAPDSGGISPVPEARS
jgi:hypothetical protein